MLMVAALASGSLKEETLDVASYVLVSQNPSNAIFPPQKLVRPWPYRPYRWRRPCYRGNRGLCGAAQESPFRIHLLRLCRRKLESVSLDHTTSRRRTEHPAESIFREHGSWDATITVLCPFTLESFMCLPLS